MNFEELLLHLARKVRWKNLEMMVNGEYQEDNHLIVKVIFFMMYWSLEFRRDSGRGRAGYLVLQRWWEQRSHGRCSSSYDRGVTATSATS